MWKILWVLKNLLSHKSRGSMGPVSLVFGLIALGVGITVGAIVFTKSWGTLDDMRDTDFSAEANASIAGVETDFWSGVDIVRVLMIVIPSGAVIGALVYYLVFQRGGGVGF